MSALMVDDKTFAKLEIKQVTGRHCLGFHRLNIIIDFQLTEHPGKEAPVILNLGGELKVKIQGTDHIIGKITPSRGGLVLKPFSHSTKASCNFELDLDSLRLEAIEELRDSVGVYFIATIWGTAFSKTNGSHQVSQDLYHNINQGTWVEILAQLGYAKYMLLEIPIAEKNTNPELAQATEHLSSAQKAMMNGNYREAVGCCRDVLESLTTALKDSDTKDPEVQQLFANSKKMDKPARQRVIRKALKVLSNPARHADANAANIEWLRKDATSMITMVATMMQWTDFDYSRNEGGKATS